MNDQIRAAVERLFSACLQLTEAGQHHAFCSFAAHINCIEVRAYPASAAYAVKPYPDPFLSESVKLAPYDWEDEAEYTTEALASLGALTDQLCGLIAQQVAA